MKVPSPNPGIIPPSPTSSSHLFGNLASPWLEWPTRSKLPLFQNLRQTNCYSFELDWPDPIYVAVGPVGRRFMMHAGLFIKQSSKLSDLANAALQKRESLVVMESVHEKTFMFFMQYAYSGTYGKAAEKCADPNHVPYNHRLKRRDKMPRHGNASETATTPPLLPPTPPRPRNNLKGEEMPLPTLDDIQDLVSHSPSELELDANLINDERWQELKKLVGYRKDAKLPYCVQCISQTGFPSGFLVSHAEIYVFAETYGISHLAKLALCKLGSALIHLELDDKVIVELLELVQYSLEESRPKKLRKIVKLYTACKIHKLANSVEFCELLGRDGDLSVSIIKSMLDRVTI